MIANLREVLPYLRPRSAEPTLFGQTVLILLCVGLATLVVLHCSRIYRQRRQKKINFYEKAEEAQLLQPQSDFLLQIARQRKVANPLQLLDSVYAFDRHLGAYAAQLADTNLDDPRLQDIAEIRSLLEFDHLPHDQALRTTYQLEVGQTLMVWPATSDTEGHSPWVVVSRDERGLGLVPLLREDMRHFDSLTNGDQLAVRFWREGDTEYSFIAEVFAVDPQDRTVFVRHADPIERKQLRDFFRLDIRFDLQLLLIPAAEGDTEAQEESEESEESEPKLPPPLQSLAAEALNLSAGGISLLTPNALPADQLLQIDPQFKGAFPLAGVLCRVVQSSRHADGYLLQCQFQDLPTTLESELVRRLYQHQIFAVSGEAIDLP